MTMVSFRTKSWLRTASVTFILLFFSVNIEITYQQSGQHPFNQMFYLILSVELIESLTGQNSLNKALPVD